MLILTRRVQESIVIDGEVVITVLEVGRNGQVRLGIEAPRSHAIHRQELAEAIALENRGAIAPDPAAVASLDALLPPLREDAP